MYSINVPREILDCLQVDSEALQNKILNLAKSMETTSPSLTVGDMISKYDVFTRTELLVMFLNAAADAGALNEKIEFFLSLGLIPDDLATAILNGSLDSEELGDNDEDSFLFL